jgi:uncharacterized membrane protein YgcG
MPHDIVPFCSIGAPAHPVARRMQLRRREFSRKTMGQLMLTRLSIVIIALLFAASLAPPPARAQDDKLKKEELAQILAPIALYPDDLLTNVLVASTYPLDVVEAARWRKEPENAKIKGDALAKALEAKDWDPSIKSLTQFPKVLQQMSDKIDWMQSLGNAFLAQQDEVMAEIQLLRKKADEAGNLKTNKQQTVSKSPGPSGEDVIVIAPASPEIVYMPVYEPTVVYGDWWYPSYPPYYWPYPGASFVNGFFWGAGIAIAGNIWGWGHWDWHHGNIDIDVNKWNNINVNRQHITSNKWEHNPAHRGPVPYKNKELRDKYKQTDRRPAANKDFRGFDKGEIDRSKVESKLKDADRANIKQNLPRDGGQNIRNKAGDINKGNRDIKKASARPAAPAAFDVKRGSDVKKYSDRGRASRTSMSSGGGHRGGGGGRGGGGDRGGGGRRR